MGLSAGNAGPAENGPSTLSYGIILTNMFDPGFAVPVAFFATIAYIAKLIGDTRIRRKALESRVSDDRAEAVVNRQWPEPSTRSALKWGLVILSLGVGMLLVDLLAVSFESPLAYAILLLATGTALLGYYLIERDEDAPRASDERSVPPSEAQSPSEPVGTTDL